MVYPAWTCGERWLIPDILDNVGWYNIINFSSLFLCQGCHNGGCFRLLCLVGSMIIKYDHFQTGTVDWHLILLRPPIIVQDEDNCGMIICYKWLSEPVSTHDSLVALRCTYINITKGFRLFPSMVIERIVDQYRTSSFKSIFAGSTSKSIAGLVL